MPSSRLACKRAEVPAVLRTFVDSGKCPSRLAAPTLKPAPSMPSLPPLPRRLFFPLLLLLASARAADPQDQLLETPPVSARLHVLAPPPDVAAPLLVRLEARVPKLSMEETLTTGQPGSFRPEPQLAGWFHIPHLRLRNIEEEEQTEGDTVRFLWTCRWECRLPGKYSLPSLPVLFRPVTAAGAPLELLFAPVPVEVRALIPGDPDSAQPRPPISKLPAPASPVLRWTLVTLVVIAWIGTRSLYIRRRRSRSLAISRASRRPPHREALERLREMDSCQEAYLLLRGFVREVTGLDPAHCPPAEIAQRAGWKDASRRDRLLALADELQAAAFSREQAPLPLPLRSRFQEFLRTFDA